jgi:tetratricopeptide (TPR) repeat protein
MQLEAIVCAAQEELDRLNGSLLIRDEADQGNYATPLGSVWISLERERISAQLKNLEGVLSVSSGHVEVIRLKGLYLKRLGQLPKMIKFLSDNKHHFANRTEIYNDLIGAYLIINQCDEAQSVLNELSVEQQEEPRSLYHRGLLAEKQSDFETARRFYLSALKKSPRYSTAQFRLASILENKDPTTSLEFYARVLDINERHFGAAKKLALLNLKYRDAGTASRFLDRALKLYPNDTECLYHRFRLRGQGYVKQIESEHLSDPKVLPEMTAALAFAFLHFNERQKFQTYYDVDTLVSVFETNAFNTRSDLAKYNVDLAACLENQESLILDFNTSKADGRYYTLDLMPDVPEHAPLQRFVECMKSQVKDYLKGYAYQKDHPYFGKVPKKYDFWFDGSITDPGARIAAHLHTGNNWGTFVYYVRVPELKGDQPQNAASIEFGRPNFEIDLDIPTRVVRPKDGLVVGFPSYMYHKTYPYQADQTRQRRVTMNLDVMPIY